MLKILAAIVLTTGTPHDLESHHDFRLPHMETAAPAADRRCTGNRELTVCAKQGESPRLISREVNLAQPRHLALLRIAPSHCANPVENGLRCIRPTVFTRFNLDD